MLKRILARLSAVFLLFSFSLGCAMAEPPSVAYAGGGIVGDMAAMPAMPPPPPSGPMPATGFKSDSMEGALASMSQPGGSNATPASGGEAFVQRGPMLIYTATLHLAVFQVSEASKEVEAMARETGGFLARREDTSIQIRVPAAKFEDVIKRLEKLGDVLHRNVVAEDVTEQYMDVEVRLKNARAIRERLAQLLEKATKVEESLNIEKELTRVGTDIEVLEGKLKYLRDRAQYSTITINFQAKQTDNVNASNVRLPVPWLNQLGLGRLLNL